jgi:hypothetical protein
MGFARSGQIGQIVFHNFARLITESGAYLFFLAVDVIGVRFYVNFFVGNCYKHC